MNADRWFLPFTLCFICVSYSKNEQYNENFCEDLDFCEVQKLVAPLGSSTLLPCMLTNSSPEWVSWVHTPEMKLVNLSTKGRIKFLDPRSGRVKAFPNQGLKGNFSISIDMLDNSDLGCYRCTQEGACLQVELAAETQSKDMWLLIYICAGLAAVTLLSACSWIFCYIKRSNTNKPAGANNEGQTAGASAPPQEISLPPIRELQQENEVHNPANYLDNPTNHSNVRGAQHHMDQTQPTQSTSGIYPNLNQFNFERAGSQKTKQRFHRELINRLRQTSISRHYYANQHELNKQQQQAKSTQAENRHTGAGKTKAKENCEYQNPIYNRSTEQLNRL
ncbi:uncharacterized protein LOC113169874 isoform X2 [Anabas testudineus]|uniref:uncharacterized protein LOC113169874 isoform X2 n=1 Tax=Anabas testudineus TaxID=64144 RepID=UPI000E458A97|nr:uncharacterized protein LOC113169874 isoform X2 [Anabas testudineus]